MRFLLAFLRWLAPPLDRCGPFGGLLWASTAVPAPIKGKVYKVIPVSEPHVVSKLGRQWLGGFTLSIRATNALLELGLDIATDGCRVQPFSYCPHGNPSNGMLWGDAATRPRRGMKPFKPGSVGPVSKSEMERDLMVLSTPFVVRTALAQPTHTDGRKHYPGCGCI